MESDKWSFMLGLREKNRLNKEKKITRNTKRKKNLEKAD